MSLMMQDMAMKPVGKSKKWWYLIFFYLSKLFIIKTKMKEI